jgi:hypothetical protein
MAHIYHGSDELILTQVNRQNFNTGLSRIDATYKCRTTKADFLEPQLFAGLRLPGYSDFIIRDNANRVDSPDGFTTFTSAAFYGTLVTSPNALNLIPSILGAQHDAFTILADLYRVGAGSNSYRKVTVYALSDTLTRKFTMLTTSSVTSLDVPTQKLTFKVIKAIDEFGFVIPKSFLNKLASKLIYTTNIININRSNFGGFDEVQITWGIAFDPAKAISI